MKEFWNERYAQTNYAYGEEPNAFFREQLKALTPDTLLLPAEGEGRNAVFAARQGWEVTAFDLSEEGKKKATQLADRHGVSLNYQVGEFSSHQFPVGSFAAIGLIYAHFPPPVRDAYYRQIDEWLQPGGTIIFEAFSKQHLPIRLENPEAGGPKDAAMLFTVDELRALYPTYQVNILEEKEIELQEGTYHRGRASVIRFVGTKV